jgi:hypothetical protein
VPACGPGVERGQQPGLGPAHQARCSTHTCAATAQLQTAEGQTGCSSATAGAAAAAAAAGTGSSSKLECCFTHTRQPTAGLQNTRHPAVATPAELVTYIEWPYHNNAKLQTSTHRCRSCCCGRHACCRTAGQVGCPPPHPPSTQSDRMPPLTCSWLIYLLSHLRGGGTPSRTSRTPTATKPAGFSLLRPPDRGPLSRAASTGLQAAHSTAVSQTVHRACSRCRISLTSQTRP